MARRPDAPRTNRGRARAIEDAERRLVEEALRANGNNIRATARALGLARATLYRKLAKYKLTAT